jgi:hypothetical protein
VRVVVTGGTGFIGRRVVRALVERGDDAVVLSRGEVREALGARPHCCRGAGAVELRAWTPEKAGEWQSVVAGADAVIHLAGAGVMDERWTPERREVLRGSRIRSTELLAEAIRRAEKKPRVFVSASAVGYYGMRSDDRILTEDAPPGDDFLATLTRDWEAAAGPAREAGVRVCHPRIGIVLGHGGGAFDRLVAPFRMFVGGPIGTGTQYVSWIHLVDTVRALEHALDHDVSGPFNVTAPEPVTMNELARAIGAALDRPSSFRVPALALKVALGPDRAEVLLTGQRAIPQKLSDSGFAFVFPELASALADLVAPREHVSL